MSENYPKPLDWSFPSDPLSCTGGKTIDCPTKVTCKVYGCQAQSRKKALGPCQGHSLESEKEEAKAADPFAVQVGGSHYKTFKIQPTEFIIANGLDFCTGNVIKYVVRKKGDKQTRLDDLNKAKHYIDMMINAEGLL